MPNKNDVNIELLYPNDLFLKGEELFEKNAVVETSNVDKGLFNFTIKDGTDIEVEWLKPLTRFQKATCSCSFFKENKVCKHIIAALISYKDSIKYEISKKNEKEIISRHSSLNINNILEGISKEEIKNFIKAYSKNDRKFFTALKVQFARRVNLADNEKKYKSLLDSIIKPIATDINIYRISDVKALLNITEDFYNQAQDSLALTEYGEAFHLCKVTLSKLCYVYQYTIHCIGELEQQISNNHILIRQLLQESESHELSEGIIEYLLELVQVSYYPFLNLNENAITLLSDLNKLPVDIFDIIKLQIKRKKEKENEVVMLLALEVLLKYKSKQETKIDSKYQSLVSKISTQFYDKKMIAECIAFSKNYLELGGDNLINYLKSLKENKTKNFIGEMARLFTEYQNLSIVDFALSNLSTKEINEFREQVLKSFKKKKINVNKYYYFLAKTNQLEMLMAELSDKKDFRMLMQYDHYFIESLQENLASLYETMMEDYLNNHIGTHSQVFISEIFDHLNKIKATKVSKKLGLLIDMKFSHRVGLTDINIQH